MFEPAVQMAVVTFCNFMILIEDQAGAGVTERRDFLIAVAVKATVCFLLDDIVARDAGHMVLLQRLDFRDPIFRAVAAPATVLAVTAHTTETEPLDVFLVPEGHQSAPFILGFVHLDHRLFNIGMKYTHDIAWIRNHHHRRIGRLFRMANGAIGFVTPLTMTVQTLAVVGTLQPWLLKVGGAQ